MEKRFKYDIKTEDVFLIFSAFLFLWIRFHHFDIVLERDEGEFAYAGQEILRGKLPYKDFYNMKFPGTYYFYALIFYFLGDSASSIKISLIAINFSSAFFVFKIAKSWYNKQIGKLSAGIFFIYCSCYSAQGWTANAEHYVVLFGLLGICFSSLYISTSKLTHLFISGLSLSIATICKQQGILLAIFPAIQLINKNVIYSWKKFFSYAFLKEISIYAVGFFVPMGLMIFYFYENDVLTSFYFFTFKYAASYGNQVIPFEGLWHFRPIFWDAFGFWVLFFSMVYNAIKRKSFFKIHSNVILLFACCFAATSTGWYYRAHYFQLMFPAAAIMSAFMVFHIKDIWKFKLISTQNYLILSCLAVLVLQAGYIFIDSNEKITDNMYPPEDFFNHKKYITDKLTEKFGDKNYKIGIIGNEPEIFFYSKRQSSSGFMYIYSLVEKQKYADSLTTKFFNEMENTKPELMMYFTDYKSSSPENPKTAQLITIFYNQFKQNYIPIGKLDSLGEHTQLTWLAREKNNLNVDSAFYGVIYLRKDLEIPKTFFE